MKLIENNMIFYFLVFITFLLTCVAASDPIENLIESQGYSVKSYKVTTKDKYVLGLYRIPARVQSTAKTVLIMHGLLASAAEFLVLGNDSSYPYLLSDAGYDVWLGNARGTAYSKEHTTLNVTESNKSYWHFSWHEIGKYDLPAIIDFALQETNQTKLHYIGHSQGTTVLFVLLSERPEFNDKISTFHALSPIIFMNFISNYMSSMMNTYTRLEPYLNGMQMYEFPSQIDNIKSTAKRYCGNKTVSMCLQYGFSLVRSPVNLVDQKVMMRILEYCLSTVSIYQFAHYRQIARSGMYKRILLRRFEKYNYSRDKNIKLYNDIRPPVYQIANIAVKMQIFYGTSDIFLSVKDVQHVLRTFDKNIIDTVKLDGKNHLDYLFDKETTQMIFQKIIDFNNKLAIDDRQNS